MIAGQVSKPLLSLQSEMNAKLRGEDKAATSDNELNEPLLAPHNTNLRLTSAVAGVMPGGTPTLNQPILIPFNMAGKLGGQQGLVLTLPTANLTNIQRLVAAAAAGGIMTLPLQNLQGCLPTSPHQGKLPRSKPLWSLGFVGAKGDVIWSCFSNTPSHRLSHRLTTPIRSRSIWNRFLGSGLVSPSATISSVGQYFKSISPSSCASRT
uniref:Uncharacterized protein n=1 Tax=Sphenodon punctatus TaxID=8508 RepID=A0A8D0L334_SPHPU